jgi:hypothetical protein
MKKNDNSYVKPTWPKFFMMFMTFFILIAVTHHLIAPMDLGFNTSDPLQLGVGFLISYGGAFILTFILLALPITAIAQKISKSKKTSPRIVSVFFKALCLNLALNLLLLVGSRYAYTTEQDQLKSPKRDSSIAPLVVWVTSQDSAGLRNVDMTQQWLKNVEEWALGTTLDKAKERYQMNGYDPSGFNPHLTAGSVYNFIDGQKLGVITISAENMFQSLIIIGLKGNELYRITAYRESDHQIPAYDGECGSKIKEVFGVALREN